MQFQVLYKVVILVFINIASLFGNILVCFSVYKNTRLRTKIGIVILALAATDLLSALIIIPLSTASMALSENNMDLMPEWLTSNKNGPLCYLQCFMVYTLYGMSLFLMAEAAFIRYLCVVHPSLYRRYITIKTILAASGINCLIVLALQASVLVPEYAVARFISKNNLCMMSFPKKEHKSIEAGLLWTIIVTWFVIPVAVSFFSYIAIFCKVKKHNRSIHITSKSLDKKGEKKRKSTKSTADMESKKQAIADDGKPETQDGEQLEKFDNNVCLSANRDTKPLSHFLERHDLSQGGSSHVHIRRQGDYTHSDDIHIQATNDNTIIDDTRVTSMGDKGKHYAKVCGRKRHNSGEKIGSMCEDILRDRNIHIPLKGTMLVMETESSQSQTVEITSMDKIQESKIHQVDSGTCSSQNDVMTSISNQYKTQRSEAKVTKTVMAVFAGFLCCWLPAVVDFAIAQTQKLGSYHGLVIPICCALSSAVNPFIYGVADRRFRQTYKKILTCKNV